MDEDTRMRHLAQHLREEAAAYGKRYWAARANHDLTVAECEALESARWACICKAEEIEHHLGGD